MTYIEIRSAGMSESGKTKRFVVRAKSDDALLGRIQWFGRWRCYVFQPCFPTTFEHVCLSEIAAFIEAETKAHRKMDAHARA